jgi:hypothetical protein
MAWQLLWELTAYEASLCQEFILDMAHSVLHWCSFFINPFSVKRQLRVKINKNKAEAGNSIFYIE